MPLNKETLSMNFMFQTIIKIRNCLPAILLVAPIVYADQMFTLISPEEYAEALTLVQPDDLDYMPKAVLDAPKIRVKSPVASASLVSPVDIEVYFEAANGAAIDMKSLKILYVMLFKKDVTSRILEHAEVGADFLKVSGAKLPTGKHTFILKIQDTQMRKASQKFEVVVEG
jgi:hypothetical protein